MTGAVGDQKAQVGAGRGMRGLVTDAALVRPAAVAMAETGEAALRELHTTIASRQPFLPWLGAPLKHLIRRDAEGVLDAKELAELVEQR